MTDIFELEKNLENQLILLKKKFGLCAIKAEFEAEGSSFRDLVRLRYFKEYSYEEISQELDIPLGTVKAQLHRSRNQLFKIMSGAKDSI